MIFERGMLSLLLIFLGFFTVCHNVQWLPLSLLTSYSSIFWQRLYYRLGLLLPASDSI